MVKPGACRVAMRTELRCCSAECLLARQDARQDDSQQQTAGAAVQHDRPQQSGLVLRGPRPGECDAAGSFYEDRVSMTRWGGLVLRGLGEYDGAATIDKCCTRHGPSVGYAYQHAPTRLLKQTPTKLHNSHTGAHIRVDARHCYIDVVGCSLHAVESCVCYRLRARAPTRSPTRTRCRARCPSTAW